MFRRPKRQVATLNMEPVEGFIIKDRLVLIKDLKFSVQKTSQEGIFNVVCQKKRFVKKGEIYVGERTAVSNSNRYEDPGSEIHEGWAGEPGSAVDGEESSN